MWWQPPENRNLKIKDAADAVWCCPAIRKQRKRVGRKGQKEREKERELCYGQMSMQVKNISIIFNRISSDPWGKSEWDHPLPLCSLSFHLSICSGLMHNFITPHLIVRVAGRASVCVTANRGRWKSSGIMDRRGKPHHFIFMDRQLVKVMGLHGPLWAAGHKHRWTECGIPVLDKSYCVLATSCLLYNTSTANIYIWNMEL